MFEFDFKVGREGPKYTMATKSKIKTDQESYGASLFCFKSEIATPQYSFSMKPNSFLNENQLFPKKSKEPGPGQYEEKPNSFRPKVHGAKFSKSVRESMSAKFVTPGPGSYEAAKDEPRRQYAIQESKKLGNMSLDKVMNPGPAMYPIHEIQHKGQMRSFIGGKIPDLEKKELEFVLPGPGTYTAGIQEHVGSYKIMQPSEPKKK